MTTQEYIRLYLSPKALWFAALKMYLNYLWYFVPVGALPFLFAGLKWNSFNLSNAELAFAVTILSLVLFIPCFIVCYLVHFMRAKNSELRSITKKEAGLSVANIFP